MAANKPPRGQIAWSQVKASLADFDRAALIALLQDLYAASRENQAFLHSRFDLGEDPLRPYKQTIARSLWPDLNKPVSVAAAKKAISSYNKASGHVEGTAELMVFFCEQAAGFVHDMALQDEGYFDALLRMYARALTAAATLQDVERADKTKRLGQVRALCRDIGYGVYDEMTALLEESGFDSQE